MNKKILIITGGGKKHLEEFKKFGREFGAKISIASFSQVSYLTQGKSTQVLIDGKDAKNFEVVYYRLVGRRLEDAALLADYITSHNIPIIDTCYRSSKIFPLTQSKAQELRLLYNKKIPVPKTYFASLKNIEEKAQKKLGFPFVIKRTDGRKSDSVYSPRTQDKLAQLILELREQEKSGKRFLAQEFVKGSQRLRVLIIGGKPIACITRGTRWRRRFVEKVNGQIPEKISAVVNPIPKDVSLLAKRAAKALGLEIAGVDILVVDKTQEKIVLEVNSAPRWYSVTRDTGISVEREVVKYLASLC